MNKISYSHILLLFISFIIMQSAGCSKIKEVEYKGIANTKLESLSLSKAALQVSLSYYNPNNFGIDVKQTNLSLYLNNTFIGVAEQPNKTNIPRNASFTFPVVVRFDPVKVLGTAFTSLFNKRNQLRIEGSAKLGKGGMYLSVPIKISEEVSILK